MLAYCSELCFCCSWSTCRMLSVSAPFACWCLVFSSACVVVLGCACTPDMHSVNPPLSPAPVLSPVALCPLLPRTSTSWLLEPLCSTRSVRASFGSNASCMKVSMLDNLLCMYVSINLSITIMAVNCSSPLIEITFASCRREYLPSFKIPHLHPQTCRQTHRRRESETVFVYSHKWE